MGAYVERCAQDFTEALEDPCDFDVGKLARLQQLTQKIATAFPTPADGAVGDLQHPYLEVDGLLPYARELDRLFETISSKQRNFSTSNRS